jgi:hypothetical protein
MTVAALRRGSLLTLVDDFVIGFDDIVRGLP